MLKNAKKCYINKNIGQKRYQQYAAECIWLTIWLSPSEIENTTSYHQIATFVINNDNLFENEIISVI